MKSFLLLILMFTFANCICPTVLPIQYSSTHMPSLTSAEFLNSNQLILTLTSDAFVESRNYGFQFENESEQECLGDFHFGTNWNSSIDPITCSLSQSFIFNWNELSFGISSSQKSKCGFSILDVDDLIIFNATLIVTTTDTLDSINGSTILRNTSFPVSLSISFPKMSTVHTSGLTTLAPINVLSAITLQSYNVSSHSGIIRLFTSVQFPFSLDSIQMLTTGDVGIIVNASKSANQDGIYCGLLNDCNVNFDLQISGDICRLRGNFTVKIEIGCRALDGCGLLGLGTQYAIISWLTDSSNLCGVVNENVGLSVGLKTYLEDYTTEKRGFETNQKIYLKASANSSQVSVESLFIKNCTLYFGNSQVAIPPLPILVGGTLTNRANSTVGYSAVSVGSVPSFQAEIIISPNVFNVTTDKNITVVISCFIGVQYQNVAFSKRFVIGNEKLPRLKRGDSPLFSISSQVSSQISITREPTYRFSDINQVSNSFSISKPTFEMLMFILIIICFSVLF